MTSSLSSTENYTNTTYFDHFACNICLEVLQDPVQCVENEHYFCKKCVTDHLTRTHTCPVCQERLTLETLRPIPRIVATLLQLIRSPKCKYASRGCTTDVSHESLLLHHDECGFAPVQCSHEGCEATVNRQDVDSHQQKCEFRSITCDDCQEVMKRKEYETHGCVLRRDVNENRRDLSEMQKILLEIQDVQHRQGEQMREMKPTQPCSAQDYTYILKEPSETQSGNLEEGKDESDNVRSPNVTSLDIATVAISSPLENLDCADKQIFVAGGGKRSHEIFNWSTQQWSLHSNTLFFDHKDAFSIVCDSKVMICGGTDTPRVECVDAESVSTIPLQLPGTECGIGVLCGDKILTFAQSVSATSLKSPFKTTTLVYYNDARKFASYGVACVNENAVVLVGGYNKYLNGPGMPYKPPNFKEDVVLFNPATKVSTKLAPLPFHLSDMAVVVHNGNIIILGGYKQHRQLTNDVMMYDITKQQCSKLPSMLEKRARCSAVIVGNTVVAIGGRSEDERCEEINLKTVEYLVLGENSWKRLPSMHCERAGAAACFLP